MLSTRTISRLVGVFLVLMSAAAARAQRVQPFIEPGFFHHDLQFFAPAAEIDTYGGDPVQRYGWFGSYNRMYIGVSRPAASQWVPSLPAPLPTPPATSVTLQTVNDPSFDEFDMTWGNRWDLGYMVDDIDHDHGWLISYMHIDGPNLGEVLHQQRLNRLNEDDEGRAPPDEDPEAPEPPSDRNDAGPPNRERFYDITDTLNQCKLNSLELNKIFRLDPLNHGGLLEPFVGFRYIQFEDTTIRQQWAAVALETGGGFIFDPGTPDIIIPTDPPTIIPGRPPGFIPVPEEFEGFEVLDTLHGRFTNQMIGGQVGFRWLRRVNKWNLSSEFRAFGMHNFQHVHLERTNVFTAYDDGRAAGSEVQFIDTVKATNDFHRTATMVGTDIRALAAYEITRDFKLEVGVQFLGFFTGIGRGININVNSETVVMVGTTFGFTINR
jgi:hypothetical protein